MKNEKENTPEVQKSSRAQSMFTFSVALGRKNLEKLLSMLPPHAIVRHSGWKEGDHTEIVVFRREAKQVMRKAVEFFRSKNIKRYTNDGKVRLFSSFGDVFQKPFLKKLGLVQTDCGIVFAECEKKYLRSFEPVLPPEDEAFREWDKEVSKLLAEFTEKKQIKAKKWLELTTPTLKNPGIASC